MFEEEFDESLIVSTRTEYDAEENVLRPKTMDGYVGQEKVKENLFITGGVAYGAAFLAILAEKAVFFALEMLITTFI